MKRLTMSRRKQLLVGLGLSCICATASFAQPTGPSGLEKSMVAYQFDGIYEGNSQPVTTNDKGCRPSQEVALEVNNGRFKLPWNDRQVFDAQIARNGTFSATSGEPLVQAEKHMTIIPTLQGYIGPAGLVADYGTRWCRYRLEASQSSAEQRLSERTGRVAPQP
jgi:hypothetical protein